MGDFLYVSCDAREFTSITWYPGFEQPLTFNSRSFHYAHRSRYPVIDLFAGPGGMSEGFSFLRDENDEPVFRSIMSIEMERTTHATLRLRAFSFAILWMRMDGCPKITSTISELLPVRISKD